MPRECVLITWIDSATHGGGWVADEDHQGRGMMTCRSAGWVLEQTEDVVVIAGHMTSEDQAFGVMTVPLICITDWETIEEE